MGSSTGSVASPSGTPAPSVVRRPRRHLVRNVVIGVVAVAVVVAVLTLVPFPHSFTATLSSSISADGVQVFSFPKGAQISGTWSTIDAVAVTFTVFDSNGNVVFEGNASYGQFAFQANGSAYTFDASSYSSETTTVSGSYSAVLWAIASV